MQMNRKEKKDPNETSFRIIRLLRELMTSPSLLYDYFFLFLIRAGEDYILWKNLEAAICGKGGQGIRKEEKKKLKEDAIRKQ